MQTEIKILRLQCYILHKAEFVGNGRSWLPLGTYGIHSWSRNFTLQNAMSSQVLVTVQ